MIELSVFAGPAPGPHLLFLGGVHGDEKPGYHSLDLLHQKLHSGSVRLQRGKVTIAARVNAQAVKYGRRCIDENLNRIVRRHDSPATHEQRLANELVVLIDAADAVLDLHGTPAPTRPFVFLDDETPANQAWAAALGTEYQLTGWPALYALSGTVTTTEYAQSLGKRALTVEVGQNEDPSCAARGCEFALRSLAHFGLSAAMSPVKAARSLSLTGVVYREREGAFTRDLKNFDLVKKGELLARYADGVELTAMEDATVVMPFERVELGGAWYYLAVTAKDDADNAAAIPS